MSNLTDFHRIIKNPLVVLISILKYETNNKLKLRNLPELSVDIENLTQTLYVTSFNMWLYKQSNCNNCMIILNEKEYMLWVHNMSI